jgi:nicotinamidase-related amidase
MVQQKTDTALLVMDMQEVLINSLPGSEQLVSNVAKAIKHARETGIPVIYGVVAFREGFPEVSPEHKAFSQIKTRMQGSSPEAMMKIVPALAPEDNEVVVVKKRYSTFTGSDLEVILRSQGIRHLVLSGVITSGVVLATLLEAADKDYRITVLSDGCKDRDDNVHQVLMDSVFARLATITACEDWSR